MSKSSSDIIEKKRNELKDLQLFAQVCANALDRATKAVGQVELSKKINEELGDSPAFQSEEHFERAKAHAAEIAKFAEAQKDDGFPQLYSVLVVRLWTILEALIDELSTEALRDPSSCGDHPLLSRLKGPLIEFRKASPEEQAEFLADTLKQAVDASLKPGIGRFEAILEPTGLGGHVNDSVRKLFFELSQVRNVIVHKSGRVDRRLAESCPWLKVQRGDSVPVDAETFERYLLCTYWYLLELKGRTQERSGSERSGKIEGIQNELLKAINACASENNDTPNETKPQIA